MVRIHWFYTSLFWIAVVTFFVCLGVIHFQAVSAHAETLDAQQSVDGFVLMELPKDKPWYSQMLLLAAKQEGLIQEGSLNSKKEEKQWAKLVSEAKFQTLGGKTLIEVMETQNNRKANSLVDGYYYVPNKATLLICLKELMQTNPKVALASSASQLPEQAQSLQAQEQQVQSLQKQAAQVPQQPANPNAAFAALLPLLKKNLTKEAIEQLGGEAALKKVEENPEGFFTKLVGALNQVPVLQEKFENANIAYQELKQKFDFYAKVVTGFFGAILLVLCYTAYGMFKSRADIAELVRQKNESLEASEKLKRDVLTLKKESGENKADLVITRNVVKQYFTAIEKGDDSQIHEAGTKLLNIVQPVQSQQTQPDEAQALKNAKSLAQQRRIMSAILANQRSEADYQMAA